MNERKYTQTNTADRQPEK